MISFLILMFTHNKIFPSVIFVLDVQYLCAQRGLLIFARHYHQLCHSQESSIILLIIVNYLCFSGTCSSYTSVQKVILLQVKMKFIILYYINKCCLEAYRHKKIGLV